MAFEIFSKKVQRKGIPAVSITKGKIFQFNITASVKFKDDVIEQVLLLWDKEKRLIGIRPITKKDERAYRVRWGKRGDACGFSAVTFVRYIGYDASQTRSMDLKWDEGQELFLIEVPKEYLKEEGEELTLREAKRKIRVSAKRAETP